MKTINDKLIAVQVPEDASDFWVNNIGCIRYSHNNGRQSSVIEPMNFYATKDNCKILGKLSELPEFITLLQSHGVDTNNPNKLLILEKL